MECSIEIMLKTTNAQIFKYKFSKILWTHKYEIVYNYLPKTPNPNIWKEFSSELILKTKTIRYIMVARTNFQKFKKLKNYIPKLKINE